FDEGNLSQARECWEVITREDDPKAYVSARLYLGLSYFKENNLSKARDCWEVISREDDPEAYAIVQTKLFFLFVREADNLQAHKYWKNLCEISVLPKYNWCGNEWLFFIIKKINSFIPNNKDIDRAIELFKLLSNINDSADRIRKALHMNSDLFCKALHMDSNLLDDNVIAHADLTKLEVFFAHYTKVEVAQKIIQNGSFHLGISNYMNDPTEGKILLTEWEIPVSYNDHLLAFLTSFTFNENSLNQFRLYGKENNKEGSGVSLVVTNSFFDNQFNPEKIAHVNTSWLYQNTYQIIPNLIDDKEKKNDQCKIDSKLKKLSDPLPLFRCIYMDPMTNYLSVAHQSKSSFRSNMSLYLDNKVEDIEVIFEKLWAFYIATMDQITKDVKTKMQEIKNNIDEIRNLIEQEITAHQNKIYEAIATTLLPIIYLTKHAAFEEEAECRILYITSILDDVIQWQGDRVYVEYTTNLADQYQQGKQSRHYLEKIYLGPNADPRAELGIKKCWIDKMRSKGMPNNDIKIPTLKKSEMPLAKS
ncbi:hypothetical protein, partial [Commensalibacter papalotli (ex Botero et al. 2024)]|uniref:hypothetical protein n=1 Tax=Commensalibacter papalotli (ex Botero et al. 2024) TaxID=2972766 RepID=UPI0022FFA5F1